MTFNPCRSEVRQVELHSLQKAQQLNGQRGEIVGFDDKQLPAPASMIVGFDGLEGASWASSPLSFPPLGHICLWVKTWIPKPG